MARRRRSLGKPVRPLVTLLLLLIAPLASGCLSSPEPVSSIPKLMMDYADNRTKFYVMGTSDDYRYLSISVRVTGDEGNGSVWQESNTLVMQGTTPLASFWLNVTAMTKKDVYMLNITAETSREDGIAFTITEYDRGITALPPKIIKTTDLPWKMLLDKRVVE